MQRESLPAGIWKKASLPRSPLTLLLSSSRDRNLSSTTRCAGAPAPPRGQAQGVVGRHDDGLGQKPAQASSHVVEETIHQGKRVLRTAEWHGALSAGAAERRTRERLKRSRVSSALLDSSAFR
ncbi:hypothetical protein DIPPA_11151 [Diplonema papillatum]|nr:hypothetical protein DIPPA_11151 [Diplonema papillatum]